MSQVRNSPKLSRVCGGLVTISDVLKTLKKGRKSENDVQNSRLEEKHRKHCGMKEKECMKVQKITPSARGLAMISDVLKTPEKAERVKTMCGTLDLKESIRNTVE